MPSKCSVFGCNNRQSKASDRKIRFYRFPRDDHFRRVWALLCRRSEAFRGRRAVVCSDHFAEDDFIDDMKSRLLGIESPPNKRLIKPNAIPSLLLPAPAGKWYLIHCGVRKECWVKIYFINVPISLFLSYKSLMWPYQSLS